jgi:ribosomal protein S18 acetylase RimI-like enzyme
LTPSGSGFAVRPAREEDLAQAQAVIRQVLYEDMGYPNRPDWQYDVNDPRQYYVNHPRHQLLVAVDTAGSQVVGTTGVMAGGPKSPPHPAWLAARYQPERTAQLFRVYVQRDHRRRGIARALVDAARRFVVAEGGYDTIYLHTDATATPGADEFWRAMDTIEIYDARGRGEASQAVHFELRMPAGLT